MQHSGYHNVKRFCNINKLHILLIHCDYIFRILPTTNSNYFPKQRLLFGLYIWKH